MSRVLLKIWELLGRGRNTLPDGDPVFALAAVLPQSASVSQAHRKESLVLVLQLRSCS